MITITVIVQPFIQLKKAEMIINKIVKNRNTLAAAGIKKAAFALKIPITKKEITATISKILAFTWF